MGLLDYIKATGGLLGNAYDSAVNRTSGLLSDAANYKQSLTQMLDPAWQAEMRKPENMALFDKQSGDIGMAIGPGMIRTNFGRIPENYADTKKLADMIERAGNSKGYIVNREGSGVSPSQYVTFSKVGDEAGDLTRQLRISNHADKYPELASGVRTSVDPNTEVTFEQAINWLAKEGYPTNLSTRFSGIPSIAQAVEKALNPSDSQRLQRAIDAWRNKPKATRGPMPE